MRPSSYVSDPAVKPSWKVVLSLIPYLREYKGRVVLALLFLAGAKLANVGVPVALKHIVDTLDQNDIGHIVVPVAMLLLYGVLRFGSVFLGELRDAVFARVAERAMRRVSLEVFSHLHKLDLDFHLSRKTGGLARDIERGTSGIRFLLRFLLFNIIPTLFEIGLIAGILFSEFSPVFVSTVLVAVVAYVGFSIWVTEWRTRYVRESNVQDSKSNTRAVDSLLNFETVKYFGNEQYEATEYDKNLEVWETARLKNRLSLVALNTGQAFIISASVTVMMVMAAFQVSRGDITLGDFVMINAFMIQLFVPLNFLGFVYREVRQALVNIEQMFSILHETPKVRDVEDARDLKQCRGDIEFNAVSFRYTEDRPILDDVSFTIPSGKKVAIVGASGSGKSTIARLLFRFYDLSSGSVLIDGVDIRQFSQASLRRQMGVVPQDTVLFNDTIEYNIAYGRPGATAEEIQQAVNMASLREFIERLPQGLQTVVGERGLKVSGGEKQRIAIARMLLKNPPIVIFDEATSALDSQSEQSILTSLNALAENHTALVIAHRLSTVQDADKIIVLDNGKIIEQGTHSELLKHNQVYASMWRLQLEERSTEE